MIILAVSLSAATTYRSLTLSEAQNHYSNGVAGFKNQVGTVNMTQSLYSDLDIFTRFSLTQQATLRSGSTASGSFEKFQFCTNGAQDIKIYIPPHVKYFKVAAQFRPNNKSFYYATFRPDGLIDEVNAKDKVDIGATQYEQDFWSGKTVIRRLHNTDSIVFNATVKKQYNIDTSKGGYLYLSFMQAPFYLGAKTYDPRYKVGVSYSLRYDKPMTQTQKDHIMNDLIASDNTEPLEDAQQRLIRGCNGNYTVGITTEGGVTKTPKQICEEKNDGSTWNGSRCVSAVENSCLATAGNSWNGSRCISAAESSCANNPDTSWIESQCLDNDKNITAESNDTQLTLAPYRANSYNWVSEVSVKNINETQNTYVDLHVGHNPALIESALVIPKGDTWNAIIRYNNGAGELEYESFDANGLKSANNITKTTDLEGSVTLYLNDNGVPFSTLDANMRVYRETSGSSSSKSAAQIDCENRGGQYANGTCYGLSSSKSSVRSSSSRAYSSAASSKSAQQIDCENRGGQYANGTCYGVTNSSTAQSSSKSAQQVDCENRGGQYANGTCYGGSQGSSSSVSKTQDQINCENTQGVWDSTNKTCKINPSNKLLAASEGFEIDGFYIKLSSGGRYIGDAYVTADLKNAATPRTQYSDRLIWNEGALNIDGNNVRFSFGTNQDMTLLDDQYIAGYFIHYDNSPFGWVAYHKDSKSIRQITGTHAGKLLWSADVSGIKAVVEKSGNKFILKFVQDNSQGGSSSSTTSSSGNNTSSSSSSNNNQGGGGGSVFPSASR